jgi:hypothetical protein
MTPTGYLVQIFLPLTDNDGRRFESGEHAETRRELLDRYGGVTAYQRAPAQGLWKTDDGAVARDEMVIFEVMVADLDRAAWSDYRGRLERRFRQDVVLVRATASVTF